MPVRIWRIRAARPVLQSVVELLPRRPDLGARDVRERRRQRLDPRAAAGIDRDQAQLVAAPAGGHQISGKHCGLAGARW